MEHFQVTATVNHDRTSLALLSVSDGARALRPSAERAKGDPEPVLTPRCALTGCDGAGKSVFRLFDVPPQVATFESRSGLVSWGIYAAVRRRVLYNLKTPVRNAWQHSFGRVLFC